MFLNKLKEICGNCGNTFGSHHAGAAGANLYPYNYCPGHEGKMDWEKGPGTCFKSTGEYKKTV